MKEKEPNFTPAKASEGGNLENPIAAKIMRGVAEKMAEINFSDTFEFAASGKWELVNAKVVVFIDDASVHTNDRNIKLDIRVPVADLEEKINEGILEVISQRNYQNPVVDAVMVDTVGYTNDNVEIGTGINRTSVPVKK